MSREREDFFSYLIHLISLYQLISYKKRTAKSKIAWIPRNKQLRSKYRPRKNLSSFFYQTRLTLLVSISIVAIFVNQLSTWYKTRKTLITRSLFSFLIYYLNKNKYRLTNNIEGTGLKHYGCDLFSVIVHVKMS